jgi:hypothetical protein
MMHYKSPFYLTFLLLYLVSIGFGQVKKGQVGFRFLENQISAEAIGRGGMGLVMLSNSNAVFWNPAGLGWIEGMFDGNINYTRGIADINHSSFAGAINLSNWGVFSIDLLVMDYGDFYGTRRANNEQGFVETGVFSPSSYVIGFSYSRKISDRFSFGARLKYAKQDLGSTWIGVSGSDVDDPNLVIEQKKYALGEFAFDVGAIYDFLYSGIRFGAVIQNISRELKYEEEKFPLPFAASFSLVVDPISLIKQDNRNSNLLIGFETRHPRDFKEKYKFGAEYFYQNILIFRAGYMANFDEQGLTFGLGIRHIFFNSPMRLDYAIQDFGIFGAVHTFTFGISR